MIKGTRFARQAGLLVSLVVLVSASAFAQSSFDFLPDEVQDALQYAEETRADLEERREEISEEVTQGPYETDEEFSQRMERAMERGASRERRYLGVELSELAETEFTVDPDRISVQPHRRPARGEEWPITISTDLGMLDEEEEFTVRAPADSASAIDDAVAENALDAEIRYHLEGNTDDDGYFVMLDEVRLLDMARQRTLIDSVPMFVSYVFSESQELTRDSGPANFDFADGAIPTDFTMRGDADWTVTTETSSVGSHSLRAGDISHNGRTEAVYTGIVPEGRRLVGISFARRVSSESVYDELDFEVNGETRDSWSGNVGWDTV
ncbi:MAG: hypothetical protein ACOCRN_05800, partial [Spirochaetia bacterium]